MARTYDKPIIIQKINESTEKWEDVYTLHASINKAKTDSEYVNAGAVQDKRSLTFEVRFFTALKDIANNTQLYRIVFEDNPYNITDYDDYKLKHKSVKLLGVSY